MSGGDRAHDDIADRYAGAMRGVADKLCGDRFNKDLSKDNDLRYGRRGSLSVDPHLGVWRDFESGEHGGVVGLISRELQCSAADAVRWAIAEGFIEDTPRTVAGRHAQAKEPSVHLADHIVKVYSYVDEAGEPLFEVCRINPPGKPKTFLQRLPGARTWGIGDARRVLYRLPELLSRPDGATIYVVEGEKDVDRLRSLGLVATTCPGGANKWRTEYGEFLAGADVVVIPDEDDPDGDKPAERTTAIRHARTVCESAKKSAAASVRLLRLPGLGPKEDVSDWLDRGGTVEHLQGMAAACPLWPIETASRDSVPRFILWEEKQACLSGSWLIKGVIPSRGIGMIYGPSGGGKTFVALDMLLAIARGIPWRGKITKPTGVLYLSPDGGGMVQNRMVAYERERGGPFEAHFALAPSPVDLLGRMSPGDAEETMALIAHIQHTRGWSVGVVAVDTVSRAMPGGDENEARDMSRFVANLGRLAAEDRVVIGVHHTPKGDPRVLRGHSALKGADDFELLVHAREIEVMKQRDGQSGERFSFDLLPIELGRDEDNHPVTSCVVVEGRDLAPTAEKKSGLSDAEAIALTSIGNLILARGGRHRPANGGDEVTAISQAVAEAEIAAVLFPEKEGAKRSAAWSSLRNRLMRKGAICAYGDIIWVPRRTGDNVVEFSQAHRDEDEEFEY